MKITKNKSNYTLTIESVDTLIVYNPPFITDGKCVVNTEVQRMTLKGIGTAKEHVDDRLKAKTPFIMRKDRDAYTVDEKAADLTQAFYMGEASSDFDIVEPTPFFVDSEDGHNYLVFNRLHLYEIMGAYSDLTIDNQMICKAGKPVIVLTEKKKAFHTFAAIVAPVYNADKEDECANILLAGLIARGVKEEESDTDA